MYTYIISMYLEVTSLLGATMQPKELVKCMGTCVNVIHNTVARLGRWLLVIITISWPPYKSSMATMWSPLFSSWQSMVVAASPEAEAMPACGEDKQYHMPQLACIHLRVCVCLWLYTMYTMSHPIVVKWLTSLSVYTVIHMEVGWFVCSKSEA